MRNRPGIASLALLCTILAAAPAAAQRAEDAKAKAAAEALFDAGRALMKAGKLAEACEKFELSIQFEPSVGTLLNLGTCREQNREDGAAWDAFGRAAELARASGDGREGYARQRMAALARRLTFLVIAVPEPARLPGLEVLLNGSAVPAASWNQPIRVTSGTHVVRASAPGRGSFEVHTAVTTPGQEVRIELPVPAAPQPEEAPPAVIESSPVAHESAPAAEPEAPAGATGMPSRRGLALTSGIIGAAGIVVAGATFNRSAGTSFILGTAGLVAVIAGITLWSDGAPAAPGAAEPSAPSTAARIAPMLGRDLAGLQVHATF